MDLLFSWSVCCVLCAENRRFNSFSWIYSGISFDFSHFRWLPIVAMRPVGPESLHSECVLVVGVSRPKLAALFLTVMLISLFLTFHVLYDSAVYSIQVINYCRLITVNWKMINVRIVQWFQAASTASENRISILTSRLSSSGLLHHPIVYPNRVHFPKTSRRLPQVRNS